MALYPIIHPNVTQSLLHIPGVRGTLISNHFSNMEYLLFMNTYRNRWSSLETRITVLQPLKFNTLFKIRIKQTNREVKSSPNGAIK